MIHKRFFFILILFIFLCTSFISHLEAAEIRGVGGISVMAKSAKGKTHSIEIYDYMAAFIIGIDRYENLGPGHQLSYAVKDARGMEKILRENYQFNEIVTLYNEDATRARIMKAIYSFQELSPDAGLFVYFAGHGITLPGVGGKDLGYLIPFDGALDRVEMYKNISMQQIKADISPLIGAKHIFFVFDACFAGLMLDTRATLSAPQRDISYLKAITGEQVRQVLTAGARGQTVLDGGLGGHSVFTGRFIEILEGVEDYITAREIGQLLKKKVYGDAAARGHTQRPVDGEIYGTGDFVFIPDLGKKNRDLKAEVNALEAEMARLDRLEKEAAQAKDQMQQQRLERDRLKKEAELKLARIKQREKEEVLKRQQQAAQEAEAQAKARIEQEREREVRLAMLRRQAEQKRRELGGDLTGGATIESSVAELKRIKKESDQIVENFGAELKKQTSELTAFYDKKIARLSATAPWDEEFETKADYEARLTGAEQKAAPTRREKEQKLAGIRQELTQIRDSQINPLDEQMKNLNDKRFTIPSSEISFKFTSYKPGKQIMLGELTMAGEKIAYYCPMPKEKAREYKGNPDLLVPEAKMQATLNGPRLDRIVFNGPEKGEEYIGKPGEYDSNDGNYIDYGNGTVFDIRRGLMIKNPIVLMETSKGKIKIELFQKDALVTVKNFLDYTNENFFDGTIFHRVVPGFVIQAGGFTPDMGKKPTRQPIKNEATNKISNTIGTLAMARTGVIDSATSQFFINLKDNHFLDHRNETKQGYGYCVFGKVIEGMDVVTKIGQVSTAMKTQHRDVPVDPVIIKSVRLIP